MYDRFYRTPEGLIIVLLLVIFIFRWSDLYGHWAFNKASAEYAQVLIRAPDLETELIANASFANVFKDLSHYRPALLQRPELPLFTALGGGAFPKYRVVEICPVAPKDYLFIRALNRVGSLVSAKQQEMAEQWLLQLSTLCPNSFDVFKSLSRLKEMNGEYEAAIGFMEKAIAFEPHIPDGDWRHPDIPPELWKNVVVARAKSDIGNLHFKKGDYKKAVEVLEASVAAYPPGTISPWLYKMIGALAFEIGAYEKAKGAFEAGIKIDPNLSEVPMYLRKIQAKLQEGTP